LLNLPEIPHGPAKSGLEKLRAKLRAGPCLLLF